MSLFSFLTNSNYKNLNSVEFEKAISEDKNAVILDVRTVNEFRSGHIPKAINIDVMSSSFHSQVNKLEKSKNYYVYCRSGARSSSACSSLAKAGFTNLFNLRGGISAYTGKLI